MRTRFRTLSSRWATGRLEVASVKHSSRHLVMRIHINDKGNARPLAVIEIKDQDIYRLADALVDTVESFHHGQEPEEESPC